MALAGTQIGVVNAGMTQSPEVSEMVLYSSARPAVNVCRVARLATGDGPGHSEWHDHFMWHRLRRVASATGGWPGVGRSDGRCGNPLEVGGSTREPAGGPVNADGDGTMWSTSTGPIGNSVECLLDHSVGHSASSVMLWVGMV